MATVLSSERVPAAIGPYSQGIQAEGLVFISGQLPVDAFTDKLGEGIREQTKLCLDNIKSILESIDLSMKSIVKTTVFMTDLNDFTSMNQVYSSYFEENCPARSTIQVAALPKHASIEIECIAKE